MIEVIPQSPINAEVLPDNVVEIDVVSPSIVVLDILLGASVEVTGGGAVDSVNGTANQITASPTTGTVILSLPNTLITPDSLQVTGQLQVDSQANFNDDVSILAGKNLSADVGGDLQGSLPNPTVHRLHGIDIQSGNPTDNDVLQYDSGNNKWHHHSLVEAGIAAASHTHVMVDITDYDDFILKPSSPVYLKDDFLSATTTTGLIGELGWRSSNGAIAVQVAEPNHYGIIARTSTVQNSIMHMYLSAGIIDELFDWDQFVECTFVLKFLHTNTDFYFRFGISNSANGNPPATGVYFERDPANSYITPVMKESSNTNITGVQWNLDTDWHTYKIKRISNNSVQFQVDGGTIYTESISGGNIADTTGLQWFIQCTQTGATTGRGFHWDFFSTKLKGLVR